MRPREHYVIGRDSELRIVERALDDARGRRGGVVFLVGEAGIGKSRLAAEAVDTAFDSGMRVLRGRSSTTGPTIPFRPLTEALMSLFRDGEPVEELALGPYRPALGQLIPDWDTGDRASVSMVVLGEAVLRLLMASGKDRGVLLLLEDLHDADPETLAVVEYLVDNLQHTPVLLLATIRTEFCDALELAPSANRRGIGTVLELRPLTRPQVRDLVAAQLGTQPDKVPQAALQRLWDDSAGSPFLAEELLQSMVSSGTLVRGPDGWRVVGELRSDVSVTLARGILRRIDRLGPRGLSLFSAAAVLGRRFPLTVLQKMTGHRRPGPAQPPARRSRRATRRPGRALPRLVLLPALADRRGPAHPADPRQPRGAGRPSRTSSTDPAPGPARRMVPPGRAAPLPGRRPRRRRPALRRGRPTSPGNRRNRLGSSAAQPSRTPASRQHRRRQPRRSP